MSDHEAPRPDEKPEGERDTDFLRLISHQLKSPINAIQTLLETVSQGHTGEVSDKTRYFIEKAVRRSEEAREIISDLINYERYSEGERLAKEEFDICGLFYDLHSHYVPAASEKGIVLSADCPGSVRIIVLGDRTGIDHALRNLIENAVKYTPEGGTAAMMARMDEPASILAIEVSDTGYGIPENELDRIFEPFYRSVRHKSKIVGTGLGLSIVKRVAEAHGGTVSVSSEADKGSRFRMTIPYLRVEGREERTAERKRIVIIGGVTAGPKAAARLRRLDEDLDITIIEKGMFLSYSGCGLPSYISGKVSSPKELMSTGDSTARDVSFFESIKNIRIKSGTEALEINRIEKMILTRNLRDGTERRVPYDVLVLATGAGPVKPEIEGIELPGVHSLRSLEDAEAIKRELSVRKAKDVFIIGGGLIGVTTAEELIETGARITILEKKGYILLSMFDKDIADRIQAELNRKGIKIVTGVDIARIERLDGTMRINTDAGVFSADLIILSTGVRPNVDLARKAGLALGESGGIAVDSHLRTSDESIYAAGDCAESINVITKKHEYWPLGSVSTKMGRIAADNICGREREFTGSIGSAQFKVQDLNVARTGLTTRSAIMNGYTVESVVVVGRDKPGYEPGSEYVTLKIIADRETRIILGAQGFGRGNVTGAVEHLTFGVTQGMDLDSFFTVDMGYAPAFGNPVDISQTACLVLSNKMDGIIRTVSPEDFAAADVQSNVIDVSPADEYERGSIPGSVNIPLENIRFERLPYPLDAHIVLYSRTSAGAYEAYRYLSSKGFDELYVLEGGYLFWER